MTRNHTQEVQAVRVHTMDDLEPQPGAFCFEANARGLFFMCPCGCGQEGYLGFRGLSDRPSWDWDGNRELPTLNPSVRRTAGCRWHGHLTGGVWKPCGDSGQ